MARLDNGEVEIVAGVAEDFDYAAFQKDGRTPETFESGDVVQVRVSAVEGLTPATLSFDSGAPSPGGSSVTKVLNPGSGIVKFSGTDTALWSGIRWLEMNLVDSGDSNRVKQFLRCKLRVLQSQ